MLQNLRELLNQNWLGVAIGILGLIAAYIFYRRSLVRPKISFIKNSLFVIGPNSEFPSELEVFYKGKKVPLVTKSMVVIWNSGNSTLSGTQVVETDPLRIEVGIDCEVLDVELERFTRKTNAFNISISPEYPNIVKCSFDYLDPQDGVVIRVIHTGDTDITVTGTLRGIPKGLSNLGDSMEMRQSVDAFIGLSLTFLAWIFFYVVLYYAGLPISYPVRILLAGLLAIIVELILKFYASPRWKTKIPRQLSKSSKKG
jgi:hypothetical protein